MASVLSDRVSVLESHIEEDDRSLNQFFLIVMGSFVMFMQCGFAFLEAGAVRSKNVVNILIKNVLDCFIGAIIYWAVGFGFAYGDTTAESSKFIGSKYFFSIYSDDYENFEANWFFQFVFAATASTIVSGAVAERTQFGSYLVYSTFITGFVYPVVSHWCWSTTGWLTASEIESFKHYDFNCTSKTYYYTDAIGFKDFAGSAIVHCTGGMAALIGAIFIGPRIGRFERVGGKRVKTNIQGHSVPIASLGAFILFLGFLAFNGGSALQIVGGGTNHGAILSLSVMNTIIGGASGCIFSLLLNIIVAKCKGEPQYWSLLVCINGALAGMVSMCAACDDMNSGAAFGIGGIAGITLFWVSAALQYLQIDDPLDAFAVHYGGGVCGILLSPIFANYGIASNTCKIQGDAFVNSYFTNDVCGSITNTTIFANAGEAVSAFKCQDVHYKQWAWNFIGLLAISFWTAALCTLMFGTLWFFDLLRVERDVEVRGLDIKKHGEPGYPTAAYGHGWDLDGDTDMKPMKDGLDGRRNTRALIGGPKFYETTSEDGLLNLAKAYRSSHYIPTLPTVETNEAFTE